MAVSVFVQGVLWFSGFFDLHVPKLLGVKDFATLQALDKFGVFVPGNDTYPGVLADGCHRFGFGRASFRKIVAVFELIWNGFLLNLCTRTKILTGQSRNDSGQGLKTRQKWSYTEHGLKKSDIQC